MWRMTLANFKTFFRNRQNFFWSLILPIIMIVIFGAIFGHQDQTVHVGVLNRAGAPGERFLRSFRRIPAFQISYPTEPEGRREVQNGDLIALVEVPPSFGRTSPSPIKVLYSTRNAPTASAVVSAVRQIGLADTLARAHLTPDVVVSASSLSAHQLSYIDFLIGGIIAMTIMQLGLFGATVGIVQMRERGILRRLRATPLSPAGFLASRFLLHLGVGVIQISVLLALASGLFHVHFLGSFPLFLGVAFLGAVVFVTIGLGLSGLSRTAEASNSLSSVLNFFLMFLSGIFWPVSQMPTVFQDVARISPLTYFADALRDIMTLGEGLGAIEGKVLVLAGWGILAALVAWRTFRWE